MFDIGQIIGYVVGVLGVIFVAIGIYHDRKWYKENVDYESERLSYERVKFFEEEFDRLKSDLKNAQDQIRTLTTRMQVQESKALETEAQRVAALARLAALLEENGKLKELIHENNLIIPVY